MTITTSDLNYQVVRGFNGYAVGQVVPASAFASEHRAAQLIDQRYLAPATSKAVQPTVKSLLEASVRKVGELAPQVQDACLLEAALQQESREAARKVIAMRLEELNDKSTY